MKNSKKGISLIVLVITIIVIIILAAAVILTMSNNNPIAKANKAVTDSDLSEAQSALTLFLANVMGDVKNSVDIVQGADKKLMTTTLKAHNGNAIVIAVDGTASVAKDSSTAGTVITKDMLGIPKDLFEKLYIATNGVLSYTDPATPVT